MAVEGGTADRVVELLRTAKQSDEELEKVRCASPLLSRRSA